MAHPLSLVAASAPLRTPATLLTGPLATRLQHREKRPLGDLFGLSRFGVNLTRLPPGSISALFHTHSQQDEFVYILQGEPLLRVGNEQTRLQPGECAGFAAGNGLAHQLVNDTAEDVVYLEIGDRTPGDDVEYPEDDLKAQLTTSGWSFTRKDGSPLTDPDAPQSSR